MKRKILWILFIVSLLVLLVLVVRLASRPEDDWICSGGQWVRHGNPSSSQPTTLCPQAQSSAEVKPAEVLVFFGNTKNDPDVLNCDLTYSASRQVLLGSNKYLTAIAELLEGPNDEEKSAGFFTSINSGIKIPEITFSDGILTVDFASDLEVNMAGSCCVLFIRSQIVNTLKQFPEVKDVVISIAGRVDDVLPLLSG